MRSSSFILIAISAVISLFTTVNGATIISQLSYSEASSSPATQCAQANYVTAYNQTAGVCTASTSDDTSSAVYCNQDGSYMYYATWTGATCSGSAVTLTRYPTGCGVISYQTQFQCLENTGPYLPAAFGTSWPPGNDWAVTTSYRNLTSGNRVTYCIDALSAGFTKLETASKYGYCQRLSSTDTNTYDQSGFYTCSGSTMYGQQFTGTECNANNLVLIEQRSGCTNGLRIQCGSVTGGSTGTIQVGVRALEYSDSTCQTSLDQLVVKPDTCVNKQIASCVVQSGTTVVQSKRYSDAQCQTLVATDTYQPNTCTIDPTSQTSWTKASCVTDGGGIGGIGSASTIGVSIIGMIATVLISFLGAERSF